MTRRALELVRGIWLLCCPTDDEGLWKHWYVYLVAQVWINGGDIILVGLRDYQDGKADVILKYSPDEARNLKAYGELPESGEIQFVMLSLCYVSHTMLY